MTTVNVDSHTQFEETPSGVELSTLPQSRFNGAYSIAFSELPEASLEVNATIRYEIGVRIQVGFMINQQERTNPNSEELENDKSEYTNAVEDVVLIIRTILMNIYDGIEQSFFTGAGGLQFLEEPGNYAICNIGFRFGVRE